MRPKSRVRSDHERTGPPSRPATTRPPGIGRSSQSAGHPTASVVSSCATSASMRSPTRSACWRKVVAFRPAPMGSPSPIIAAAAPQGASDAHRASR